jgi:four helix bundle protein
VQGDGEGVYDSEEREYPISNKEYPRMKEKIFDLQDRLIDFAVRIIKLSEVIPESKAGKHIGAQLLRSGTSPAPNYGEAQSAESKADFIHKLKIALKELRETEIWLKIIIRAELVIPSEQLGPLLKETDELISILFKSVETAKKNKERRS